VRPTLLGVATAVLAALPVAPAGAQEPPAPEPYRDPPFTCEVHDFGTEPPPVPAPSDDPLCVEYDKTNITVSTLEAIDFLAAEPNRIVVVAGKCAYWQQDHWIVRVTPEDPAPLVEWEGSYWYDARTGTAAGILRNLRVGGEPADGTAFVEALRPLIGDEQADEMAAFADEGGGGGATFLLPEDFAYPDCPGPFGAPSEPAEPSDPSEPDGTEPGGEASVAASTADTARVAGTALPRTGGSPALGLASVGAAAAVGLRRLLRRTR
jgi:hypothetical protein